MRSRCVVSGGCVLCVCVNGEGCLGGGGGGGGLTPLKKNLVVEE